MGSQGGGGRSQLEKVWQHGGGGVFVGRKTGGSEGDHVQSASGERRCALSQGGAMARAAEGEQIWGGGGEGSGLVIPCRDIEWENTTHIQHGLVHKVNNSFTTQVSYRLYIT